MIRIHRALGPAFVCAALLLAGGFSTAEQYPDAMFQELRWRLVGPFRGGRTRAAAGVPSQPNVFYIGQVNGGVWKSDDFGRTWRPIFDGQPTQSIGAIAVAPSDPNIVYVASGEGLQRPDLSVGNGIYKSSDAGATWTHLGLRDGQQIPALAVDPRDPNRVFAAVLGHPYGANEERGIFRSTDGGANWQKVLYKDENTGGSDVQIDPANPDIVFASLWEARQGPWEDGNSYSGPGGGLYKSTDGGGTWRRISKGLPEDLAQIDVAIAPSDTRRVYATVASGREVGFYRSDDAGESWSRATEDPRPSVRIGGGDLPVPRVDPKNPDVVYTASTVTWRSADGGKTWTGIRGAPGGDDYQNIWINPNNPGIILLVSDQGGIVSVNGGASWSSWYNQPTAQLYHAIADSAFPYRVCAGQQESGSVCVASRGSDGEITFREWHPVGVIEYGYVAPDPLNPDVVYGAGRTEVSRFNWKTMQTQNVTPLPVRNANFRADRTEPLLFSPVDPHALYYATNVLFKTVNGGASWSAISPDLSRPQPGIPPSLGAMAARDPNAEKQRGVIYALGLSFKSAGTIWAGTDDGLIWLTRDGGAHWRDVTPPALTPWSKVTQLAASPFDDVTAFASVSRFRIDDLHPYIYRTRDSGKTWQLVTSGLPDNAPVDTVREDSERKGLHFAGTENAVWVSFDDGDHWQSLQLNLPHTSMRDLWIHDNDLIVATHGRSFWILDDIAPLREFSERVTTAPATLFKPSPAWRVRNNTNTDTPIPPDEAAGQNPPGGAILDYFLKESAPGEVTLEILDAAGKPVRRYSSADKPEVTEEELKKTLEVPLYWVSLSRTLPAGAGMHRWVWDLHYAPPASARHEYPIAAVSHETPREPRGPRALPGRYTVRLTAGGKSVSQPLIVKMDPRVKTPVAGLAQMFRMQQGLASMMTTGTEAASQARSAREQLEKISGQTSGPLAGSIDALNKKIGSLLGSPAGFLAPISEELTLARMEGEVGALYQAVDSADAAPTASQTAAVRQARRDFALVLARWNRLKKMDLDALNRALRAANLPEIQLGK